ncbi:MAG: guanylate kinase [Deltaproteobacteria bacterium]|nr:guanylate kinase [Deltaproteobacteria bacterium]
MGKKTGKLFIVSGPSGAGKSTLSKRVIGFFGDLGFSVSYTTRPPRPNETDGVDYRFVDEGRFDGMAEKGEFVEYAVVHGRKYGTNWKDLKRMLDRGSDVLLDIDVQGAEQMSEKVKGGVSIFVLPPSIEACAKRLNLRGDIAPSEMEKRLAAAMDEIKRAASYDYIIINDDLDGSFERLKAIITAERSKKDVVMGRVKELFTL